MDDALEEEGEEIFGAEKQAYSKAVDLRTYLNSRHSTYAQREQTTHDLSKTNPNILTPWTSSSIPATYPELPRILDPTLEKATFTHSGNGSGRSTELNYERLEWIGDAYLYVTSSLLISKTFQALPPGKASQMREMLVKNVTLSEYAKHYGFHTRARLPPEFSGKTKHGPKAQEVTKVMGDIFEAYVGSVILSDPIDGVARASAWLKSLWAMTIAEEIRENERSDQQYDSPLWRLRGADANPEEFAAQAAPISDKERLSKAIGARGIKITYKDIGKEYKDPKTSLTMFTVGVYLDGWGEKDKLLGVGTAKGKKEAGNIAARKALEDTERVAGYAEKKRLFNEQLAFETAAGEKSGDAGHQGGEPEV